MEFADHRSGAAMLSTSAPATPKPSLRSRGAMLLGPSTGIRERCCGRIRRKPTTRSWAAVRVPTKTKPVRETMGPDADIGNSPVLRTLEKMAAAC